MYQLSKDEALQEKIRETHPMGFRREELNFPLQLRSDFDELAWREHSYKESLCTPAPIHKEVAEKIWRRRSRWARVNIHNDRTYGKPFDAQYLQRHGQDLKLKELSLLSISQKAEFHHYCLFSGELSRQFDQMPYLFYFGKISNGEWRWGYQRMTWNRLVMAHRTLMAFDLNLPDFEVRYDFTTYCNIRGYGELTRTFLDGTFGLIILYKGEHVLTVAVTPTNTRLLVHQIQLKNKKGNRFLFKLPCHYIEYVLLRLRAACKGKGLQLFLAEGETAAQSVYDSYGDSDNKPENWEETRARIISVYNRDFDTLRRVGKAHQTNRVKFFRLLPKKE